VKLAVDWSAGHRDLVVIGLGLVLIAAGWLRGWAAVSA
jgi:hypothetical protein